MTGEATRVATVIVAQPAAAAVDMAADMVAVAAIGETSD
jgi:hypothetical protein